MIGKSGLVCVVCLILKTHCFHDIIYSSVTVGVWRREKNSQIDVHAFISIRFMSMGLSQAAVLSTSVIKCRFPNKMLVFQKPAHSPFQPFIILRAVF